MVIVNPQSNLHFLYKAPASESDEAYRAYRKLWIERPRNFDSGSFPLFLDIEVTNKCNYRCPFCATTYFDNNIKRGMINPNFVKKAIDEGADKELWGVKFNDRGEPLLCDKLPEYVRYAKKKGLRDVYFNTNGSLLNKEVSSWIVDSGLDRISISIEGASADIYEKYRVGGNFEQVYKNVVNLKRIRDRMGVRTPRIRIQTVLLDEIREDISHYADFWSVVADEVCCIDYKEEKSEDLRGNIKDVAWACHQLWQRMVIWWDGTILPCNEDDKGRLALGNIRDTSIERAWNSVYINLLRQKHQQGQSGEIDVCSKCYLRDSEIKKIKANR